MLSTGAGWLVRSVTPLAACAAVPLAPTYAYLAAHTRLRNLQALAAAVRPPGSELLGFDPSGDGEAVVSTADVESAGRWPSSCRACRTSWTTSPR